MTRSLLAVFIAGLLLLGCEKANTNKGEEIPGSDSEVQQQAFPFTIDLTKSAAYLGRDYMSVFLVGDLNVVVANFTLPEAQTPLHRVLLGMDKTNVITHYTGDDIETYVLPQGVHRPIPENPDYKQIQGISGLLNCQNPPVKGGFEYGRQIELSLEQIDFGNGKLYQMKPMKMTVGAFPP